MMHFLISRFPHTGQNLWFILESMAEYESLVDALHPMGARESNLKNQLLKNKEYIVNVLSGMKAKQ